VAQNDTISSERERRVLSHLSVPRNVDDLSQMLRTDVGHPTKVDPQGVHDTLEEFKRNGWAVNLGEHSDPAKLAAKVESSKARTMPDEKAEIYSRRRSQRPQDRWRLEGDLWMMTDAGRDASRAATQENVPAPMTTSQLRAAIRQEWARVKSAPLEGDLNDEQGGRLPEDYGESLGDALLEQEFRHWLDAVLKGHEETWGKGEADELRKDLPMGGGSQFSDAYEIIIVDVWNQKATATAAAPWYMALVETTAVTDADTGSTLDEPEYTGYARKTVAAADMNAGSGTSGAVTNANAIQFAACTAGTDTIIGFAHCVALTVGVMRSYGTCSSTVVSTTQTPAQFAAGAYTATVA
jgi:hypothetical protein